MVLLRENTQHLRSVDINDKVSSMIVLGGTWRLFEHINCEGRYLTLRPGRYPNALQFVKIRISSICKIDSQIEEELQVE